MFGRGCDTVSSLQPCRIVVQISEAAFVTDMVTSNYVQPSSVVPQTEVSSASRLAALKGKFDSALNDHHDFLMRQERNAQQLAERLARELVAEARLVEVKKKAALMAITMAASEKVTGRKVYPVYRSKGVAAYLRTADEGSFITRGDGVGLEDSKDQTRPLKATAKAIEVQCQHSSPIKS